MKIRNATLKDVQSIQELNNQLFDLELKESDVYLIKDWPLSKEGEEYFTNAILNGYVLVCENKNLIVGYLLGEEIEVPYYNFKIAELCNMCIDTNYRKTGIGQKLFEKFKADFEERNIKNFTVTASFKNISAINFYKKLGFIETNLTLTQFKGE